MKRLFLHLSALASTFVLLSCYQSETVIHLNKDGSGTITQEIHSSDGIKVVVNDPAAENTTPNEVDSLGFHDDDERAKAADMGEGVAFEKIEALGPQACRITFKFKDINKLGLSTGFLSTPTGKPGPDMEKGERTTFSYDDGKLTVHLPKAQEKKSDNSETAKSDLASEQEAELIKLESTIKIKVSLEVEGGIAKTDATYPGDKAISLIDLDFSKLTKDPASFKKLMDLSESFRSFEKASHGLDGAKMESKDEVSVTLK